MTSIPTHLLCYAPFPCSRCGALCERMTRAVVSNGRVGEALRPAVPVVCDECTAVEAAAADAKRDAAYARKAWARRMKVKSLGSKL